MTTCDKKIIWGWLAGMMILPCGCLRKVEPPSPTPIPEAAGQKVAREVVIDYGRRLADLFDEAAGKLNAGSLSTAADANTQLQTANMAARKAAFVPLDELLNDELGGDKWDAQRAAELFQDISAGLRRR
jgi:hypothetical protein